VLVGNGGYTAAAGVLAVEEDEADAVSYGRRFISNPDLVQRLRLRRPLSPYDPSTFYTHGAQGYTTYSTWKDPQ
ncbi:N-ethylmaleimide reductase, partial [Verticillium dahliae]